MTSELLDKVTAAVKKTGYPLELETAAKAESLGWTVFHSTEYKDPETEKYRELDLQIYKIINNRRVEVRISCKSSHSKQFVLFTRPDIYLHNLSHMAITPVCDNMEERARLPEGLRRLWFFSRRTLTVNYTMLSGDKPDRDGRTLLRDAIYSTLKSVHYRILPGELTFDQRGTIYLFVVVIKGGMYDAHLEAGSHDTVVNECDYGRLSGPIYIPKGYWEIQLENENGKSIPFQDALYWFPHNLQIELLKDTKFEDYLANAEAAFSSFNADDYPVFGKAWTSDNFPKLSPRPSLSGSDNE